MPARHLTFLSITGSMTQESVLVMVPVVSSHGRGMNYELQLTEDHFKAALSWQSLEKPSYGLAHSLWANPRDGRSFFPFPNMVRSAWEVHHILAEQQHPSASQPLQSKWHVVSGNAFKQLAGRREFIQMSLKIYMHSWYCWKAELAWE